MAAPFIFDYAKGRWVEKYLLPVGGDNIIVVLLKGTLQTDATLNNYQTLAALLAANSEADFTNYARTVQSALNITVTVNTSTGVVTADLPDQVWNSAGGVTNNSVSALLTCYRKASGDLDTVILPLTKHDLSISTTGGNLTVAVPSIGTAT